MKSILVGIGNPNFCDDGLGFWVVKAMEREIDAIHFLSPTLNMLNYLLGYELAIVTDGVKSGKVAPGTLIEFTINPGEKRSYFGGSTHSLSLIEVIATGYETFGNDMPRHIRFMGIEVEDIRTFKNSLTEPVKKAFPDLIEKIREHIHSGQEKQNPFKKFPR
jgi:hydrogenase maturation protease